MIKSVQLLQQWMKDPATLRKALSAAIILIVWGFFLLRALHTFGPGNDIVLIPYHSDAAIPVMMSNDERPITVFNT